MGHSSPLLLPPFLLPLDLVPSAELAVKLAPGANTAGGELKAGLETAPGFSSAILIRKRLCCRLRFMTCRRIKAYSANAPNTNKIQANNQISKAVT